MNGFSPYIVSAVHKERHDEKKRKATDEDIRITIYDLFNTVCADEQLRARVQQGHIFLKREIKPRILMQPSARKRKKRGQPHYGRKQPCRQRSADIIHPHLLPICKNALSVLRIPPEK